MKSVFDPIVGKKIANAKLVSGELRVTTTDGKRHRFWPTGDCCAQCWIEATEGLDLMEGATVLSGEDKEWTDMTSEDYDVLEQGFYSMHTDRGTLDLELRVSHNGYYGGSLEYTAVPAHD